MANNMKISIPKTKRQPKGGWRPKMKGSNPKRKLWLHGRQDPIDRQKPQSPILEWVDMSESQRRAIRERLDNQGN